jgi:hypothetical protein
MIVLSHFQTKPLLHQKASLDSDKRIKISPDLGLTIVDATLSKAGGLILDGGPTLSWAAIEEISDAENNCFLIEHGELQKILAFSDLTNRVYTLMPTPRAPTMLVSGIPMHRIKGTDPYRDTLEKIRPLKPVIGQVLDTATGLGYTAIEAAKTAEHVTTIELDPAALDIARLNPWSQALFYETKDPSRVTNTKITQRIGDSYDLIHDFEDETFHRIIHDPPTLSLAGHLYAQEFYQELHRVLRRGGKLFHYIGNPKSKSGRSITGGVIERLQDAGFSRVTRQSRAFGVLARK